MQVIAAAPSASLGQRLAVARSLFVALLLVVTGATLAWLFLGTPIVDVLIPNGRPTDTLVIANVLVWAVAIIVPAGLLLIGIARMAETFEAAAALRPRPLTPALRAALGPDTLAVTDLRLAGGRRVNEFVFGPFGVVVLGEVPPPSVSRNVGPRWEVRDGRGRWIPVEGPVDRTSRDADRVRSWLGNDDRDFLVRVYAAVVTDDPRVQRSPTCAVVTANDLAAWFTSLPPQRGLTTERRERITAMVREAAAGRSTVG